MLHRQDADVMRIANRQSRVDKFDQPGGNGRSDQPTRTHRLQPTTVQK